MTRKGHICPSWLLLWPPAPTYTGKCRTLRAQGTRLCPWPRSGMGPRPDSGCRGRGESFPEKPGPELDPRPHAEPGCGGPFFFVPFYPGRTTDTVKGKEALIATHRPGWSSAGGLPRGKERGFPGPGPLTNVWEVRPETGGVGSATFESPGDPRGMPWYSVIDLAVQERIYKNRPMPTPYAPPTPGFLAGELALVKWWQEPSRAHDTFSLEGQCLALQCASSPRT